MMGCAIKLYIGGYICIYPYSIAVGLSSTDKKYLGFSFTPFYGELNGEKQFIKNIEDFFIKAGGDVATIVINSILEVTEEEFYKID